MSEKKIQHTRTQALMQSARFFMSDFNETLISR